MALNEVFDVLYVVGIQHYIIIDNSWGIGNLICIDDESFDLCPACRLRRTEPIMSAEVQRQPRNPACGVTSSAKPIIYSTNRISLSFLFFVKLCQSVICSWNQVFVAIFFSSCSKFASIDRNSTARIPSIIFSLARTAASSRLNPPINYLLNVQNAGSTPGNQHQMQWQPKYPLLLQGIMIQYWVGITVLHYLE